MKSDEIYISIFLIITPLRDFSDTQSFLALVYSVPFMICNVVRHYFVNLGFVFYVEQIVRIMNMLVPSVCVLYITVPRFVNFGCDLYIPVFPDFVILACIILFIVTTIFVFLPCSQVILVKSVFLYYCFSIWTLYMSAIKIIISYQ